MVSLPHSFITAIWELVFIWIVSFQSLFVKAHVTYDSGVFLGVLHHLPQKSRELKLQISTRKLTNRMSHWLLKVLPETDLNKMTLSSYYLISFYSIKITQIHNQMFKIYSCVTHIHTHTYTHISPHLPSKKKVKKSPLAVWGQQSIQFTAGTIYMYTACHNKTTVWCQQGP